MKYLQYKDLKNRFLFNKIEINRRISKFLLLKICRISKKHLRKVLFYRFFNTRRRHLSVSNKIVRRCILTNRGRGITARLKISRVILREMLQFGVVPGYKKAVW